MIKNIFLNPPNEYRIYRLSHALPEDMEKYLVDISDLGFGGIVTNVNWHNDKTDKAKYLQCDEDFVTLDKNIDVCKKNNIGVWMYDEKGYPSGSADGLTLKDHPEFEAKGFTVLELNGTDFKLDDEYDKIIYACKKDGSPVNFSEKSVNGADLCFAVKSVFEGSHAQNCGWGPRRYPNLLDKNAVDAFIKCTYDKYFESLSNFSEFEAVFTDEPSLMSAYVNCYKNMERAFLPWQEKLPEVFYQMHGVSFFKIIHELFDKSDRFLKSKLMFWQTVSEMVNDAFFKQIQVWCRTHSVKFSGHCLLEECISMHVPLYGNLMKCLKTFDYPGVDMLTGDPEAFKYNKSFQFAMAAKYVGSTARMTGKTEKVMVEICPLVQYNGNQDYTLEQEIGTMDLIFMSGINHINSYLAPERLHGSFKYYADYFARAAYVLRSCRWCGKIGMYYPIETFQGYYHPDCIGINSGAQITDTETFAEQTMFKLYTDICKKQLDFTIIDAEWIKDADIVNNCLVCNGLEISCIVMSGVKYVDDLLEKKLSDFQLAGGCVLYAGSKPDLISVDICENPAEILAEKIAYGIEIESDNKANIFVSPYERDGVRIYYVINTGDSDNSLKIKLSDGSDFEIWCNSSGNVIEKQNELIMKPYTSVFVIEKRRDDVL